MKLANMVVDNFLPWKIIESDMRDTFVLFWTILVKGPHLLHTAPLISLTLNVEFVGNVLAEKMLPSVTKELPMA